MGGMTRRQLIRDARTQLRTSLALLNDLAAGEAGKLTVGEPGYQESLASCIRLFGKRGDLMLQRLADAAGDT